MTILQGAEPPSLDPASMSNVFAFHPALGNALYGTLMINDTETFTIAYKMATEFSSSDGGTTYNLELRPGLMFTDGTPLDASAVKFNWDRLRDPALGSTSIRQAVQVAETEVIDATNLKVTMVAPNPHFAESLVAGAMNWIASPTALEKGRQAFDENPVGAGPFTLVSWTRQSAIELEKNPDYWDAPKPYLDRLTIKSVHDSNQRINAMTTGAADLSLESTMANIAMAHEAGLETETLPTGGGQMIGMNERRAPFDDVRARRAVRLALDLDALNTIVYNGEGEVPETFFPEESPFYSNMAFQTSDPVEAQRLFDELAAEGKPVRFSFASFPTTDSRVLAEGVQAQLSTYDNVEVSIDMLDAATATTRLATGDFDMIITATIVQDPDFALWTALHSQSTGNFTGTNDAELDAALDAGRVSESFEDRKAAYNTVQERLIEVVPGIWYIRSVPSVMYDTDVHGVQLYTLGSPLPEELWIS
ncbi:ABC transporter substrate-binding protein [Rhodococcus sp. CH91]|uniref:ABC transporter substrate-binding protein n=1 Tax=Rhodococcus sp. CH91 TaxID=2910256 RepID=UPI001F4BB5B2|nr:ABC transporter substrate-binding protein [Rhodococcus sp. CH91]